MVKAEQFAQEVYPWNLVKYYPDRLSRMVVNSTVSRVRMIRRVLRREPGMLEHEEILFEDRSRVR
jgi:hypothetical protein